MSKVLILANSSSGLFDFRNGLILRLLKDGREVVVSLPDDMCTAELRAEGCRVIHTEINRRGMNPGQDLRLLKSYKAMLKDEKPDVVLTYTIKPNVYGGYMCRKLGIPYITTITGLGSAFEKSGFMKEVIVKMYRMGVKGSECVFFQNAENRGVFRKLKILGKSDALVGGSGVDLERHSFSQYPLHEQNETIFIYVGRLMREKGTDEFLESARRMHEKYGSCFKAMTIGYSDEDYDEKITRAVKDGYVEAVPFQKDIIPWLVNADCVVMPSYHEGMSNVVMEAAATGRPVIATDISGCRELVDNTESGFLIKKESADALFDAMDKFMLLDTEKRAQMGVNGRKKMEREFDRECIIDAYISKINDVIKN